MTVAYICVLVSIFIPIILVAYAKFGSKVYDNCRPRESLEKIGGRHKRAYDAQLNSYEAFPPFAAAVIIAHNAGALQSQVDTLSVSFVIFRVLYGICYVYDWPNWRSVVWLLAFACIIGLFVVSF